MATESCVNLTSSGEIGKLEPEKFIASTIIKIFLAYNRKTVVENTQNELKI